MAMTKKEREAMQAAIDRADMLAALRWTNPVERDVLPPKSGQFHREYTEGWDYNAPSSRVWQGWSNSIGHGTGPVPKPNDYTSGSQGSRAMFSTKLLALRAMRHEMERQAARMLMQVDRQIAAEESARIVKEDKP